MSKLREAADYANTHDLSDVMDDGVWVDEATPDPDPMISTSLRLPQSLLQR